MSIRWSYEQELLGTAGGTKKLEDFWGREPILVTSGDGLHDVDVTALLGHHRRTGALATLAVKPVDDPSAYGVVILDRDTRVRGFQEKPTPRRGALRPRELRRLRDRAGAARPDPADAFYDFGQDVWPALVAAGEPMYAYTTMAYWNDVGGLDELRNSILDAVIGRVRIEIPGEEIAPGVWAEEGCAIDPAANVEGPGRARPRTSSSRRARRSAGRRRSARTPAWARARRSAAPRSLPGSVVPDEGSRSRASSATRRSSPRASCGTRPRATRSSLRVVLRGRGSA